MRRFPAGLLITDLTGAQPPAPLAVNAVPSASAFGPQGDLLALAFGREVDVFARPLAKLPTS